MDSSHHMSRRAFFQKSTASLAVSVLGVGNVIDAELVRPSLHDNSVKANGWKTVAGYFGNVASGLVGFGTGCVQAENSIEKDQSQGLDDEKIRSNMNRRAIVKNIAAFAFSRVSYGLLTDKTTSFQTGRNYLGKIPSTFASFYGMGTSISSSRLG